MVLADTNSYHLFTYIDDAAVEPITRCRCAPSDRYPDETGLGETEEVFRCGMINDDLPDAELKARLKLKGIIIEDEQMLALYRDVRTIAHINVPVLILGEPGTGTTGFLTFFPCRSAA